MFADFLKRLTATDPAPLPDEDARLALTALLVRVARSDGSFDDSERDRIDRIIATRYGLSPFEAARLRGEAEGLEAEAPDTVRFTRAIKDAVPYEHRIAVIEAPEGYDTLLGELPAVSRGQPSSMAPSTGSSIL